MKSTVSQTVPQVNCISQRETQHALLCVFACRHRSHAHQHVHSVVYDPKSASNEEDSEALFRTFSEAAGLNPSDSNTVSEYIIATKRHSVSASDDQDLRAFIDLDMGVVGRERGAYLTYASQVTGRTQATGMRRLS